MEHVVRSGSGIASEQMQPLHEVKALVQQNGNNLQVMEAMLKVKTVGKMSSRFVFFNFH